ncbi:MAG TPA: hypothetical protein VGI14_18860 [Casimicrobiaceae bacterium]|jgi:hypothetical protein
MAIWIPLLVAPLLALADQAIALSMTAWACRGQHELALHVVHVAFALVTALTVFAAWLGWRRTPVATATEAAARRRFFAGMGIASSALALLVILTMWMPTWLLSSCLQ